MQNSDLLLVLGSRLNIRQTSYNWGSFARFATKIQVDIDAAELTKPTVKPEIGIHCDVKLFLSEMKRQLDDSSAPANPAHESWLAWCKERQDKYPVVPGAPEETRCPTLNPYYFMDRLFEMLGANDAVVCGTPQHHRALPGWKSKLKRD